MAGLQYPQNTPQSPVVGFYKTFNFNFNICIYIDIIFHHHFYQKTF